MPDDSLAALLLTNRLVPVDVEPQRPREFWALVDQVGDLGRLVDLTPDEMKTGLGITHALAVRIATLLDAGPKFAGPTGFLDGEAGFVISIDRRSPGTPAAVR